LTILGLGRYQIEQKHTSLWDKHRPGMTGFTQASGLSQGIFFSVDYKPGPLAKNF